MSPMRATRPSGALHALLLAALLPSADASCSGGMLCDGTTKTSCEFFSSCTWTKPGSSGGSQCSGFLSSCSSYTTQTDCERWNCDWGGSTSGGSSGGSSGGFSFCSAKLDGSFCSGDTVITCSNRAVTGSSYCSGGDCTDSGVGNAACGDRNFCAAKVAGNHCDGQYLKVCSGSQVTSTQDCRDAGCKEGIGSGVASCGEANFCLTKLTGNHCDGEVVKSCPSGAIVDICRDSSCQSLSLTAECGTVGFCRAKASGRFCDGPYLKVCASTAVTDSIYCGSCADAGVNDAECGTPRFCTAKISGQYCDGQVLKECSGGSTPASQRYCDGGCAEWGIGIAGCGAADGNGGGWAGSANRKAALASAIPIVLSFRSLCR